MELADVSRDYLRAGVAGGRGRVEHGDGTAGRGESRGNAHRVIDAAVRARTLPDYAAERATALIEAGSPRDRSVGAEWVRTAGDPAYLSAFSKIMGDPERGHLMWDAQERAAFTAVQEFRAASLSDAAGGYMVPFTLDPTIMLTNAGSTASLRDLARVVQTTSDTWSGVTSAGVTASWHGEAVEMTDDAPVLAQPTIRAERLDAFVPFSFEIEQDAVGFAAEMGAVLSDAAVQATNAAYTTGSGSGQPQGLVTGLAGTASVINAVTPETFTSADVYAVQSALPARFQTNATWLGHVATLNAVSAMQTTGGTPRFPSIDLTPPVLLRKPVSELSTMDGVINPAATEHNYSLIYGDLAQGFVIVDRIGTTIELVPHLFGANRRPTGQRGLIMWLRTGSQVVIPNAFRMLDVATTA